MVLEVFGACRLAIRCSSWWVAGDSREEACMWAGLGVNQSVDGEGEGHSTWIHVGIGPGQQGQASCILGPGRWGLI